MNPITRYLRNRAIDRRISRTRKLFLKLADDWGVAMKIGIEAELPIIKNINITYNAIRRMEKMKGK